jgi:hypothetical protein
MTERITTKHVEARFITFMQLADRAGFNTADWALVNGRAGRAWRHLRIDEKGNNSVTEFTDLLGSNAREAYTQLSGRIDALRAVLQKEREGMYKK